MINQDKYHPSIIRPNIDLRWGKYYPFPEIFNTNFTIIFIINY